MLLPIMYHHIGADRFSNAPDIFREHLRFIKENFNVVLPGDPLLPGKTNVVLVFDDAAYDFFHHVFPILSDLGVPVVLAVPTRFILDDATGIDEETRLSISTFQLMQGDIFKTAAPFCTWSELRKMGESGLIRFASHTHTHINLIQTKLFEDEFSTSKRILEEKLGQEIDSLVIPYGEFNKAILTAARLHYRYIFAVGAGDNRTWNGIDGVLFRLYGDDLNDPSSIFSRRNLLRYKFYHYRLHLKKWLKDRQRLDLPD